MSVKRYTSHERLSKLKQCKIYPKPLPKLQLHLSVQEDDNDLTVIERATLVRAWRLIEPFQRRLGRAVFHDFLVKYENLFEHFYRNHKLDAQLLHSHAKNMLKLVGKVVMELENPLEVHALLMKTMPQHETNNIPEEFMVLLSENLCQYLYDSKVFENRKSPKLLKALQKLFALIGTFNICERERKATINLRYSTMRHSLISLLSRKSTLSILRNTQSLMPSKSRML